MSCQAKLVDIDQALTDRPIAAQLAGEHDDVVVVAEPRFQRVQRRDIFPHTAAACLEEPQCEPQLLDLLSKLVKVRRVLATLRASQRLTPAPIRTTDAGRQCLEVTVLRPPPCSLLP